MGSNGSDCERAFGVGTSARWVGRISRPMLDQAVTRPFSSRWLSTAQPRTVAVSARDNLSCSNLCRCQPMVNVPCARAPAPAIATLGSPPIFDQPASGGEVDAGNQYDQDGDGHERRCSRAASPNPCSKIIGWQNFLKSVPPARPATGRSARSSPITTASRTRCWAATLVRSGCRFGADHCLPHLGQRSACTVRLGVHRRPLRRRLARRASPLTRALRVALPCRGDRP